MIISFDSTLFGSPNGNSAYTTGLIRALASAYPADEYHVFTYWRKKRKMREALGDSPAVRINNILPHPLVLGRMFRPAVDLLNGRMLREKFRRTGLHHCTNPELFTFGIERTAVTILDLIALRQEDWTAPGSREFYRKNIGRVITESAVVFTISENTRADIVRLFPEAADKVVVTYCGVDERFRCLPAPDRSFLNAFGYPESSPPFLLYVGETQPRKNVHGLIAAFSELSVKSRGDMRLVIVGDSLRRDYRERLSSLVREKELGSVVHFYRGVSHDDLVRFYNAAHALVFPSFYEGFGIPVVEAMRCGCPVLTSLSSSLPEVGGDAALYADPGDTDELRGKILRMMEDDGLRRSLREKGFRQAERFSWKKTAELTYGGYRRMAP